MNRTQNHQVPVDIARNSKDELIITWSDGKILFYPVRDLRLKCPCAECVDEFTGKPLLDPKTVPMTIVHKKIKSIGRYALAVEWSDGHKSGIFSYDFLKGIGELRT